MTLKLIACHVRNYANVRNVSRLIREGVKKTHNSCGNVRKRGGGGVSGEKEAECLET